MLSHELGFVSSWKMMTRDKGWIKPILILTLVGWIPIVGQIVLLGYALEWARLTAWGVDAAPKQHDIDYGKLFSTGGRAFLVNLLMGLVLALVVQLLLPGSAMLFASPFTNTSMDAMLAVSGFSVTALLAITIVALGSTFIHAACLRATLYDNFSAGWRLDRLFQMVARDFGGFMKTFLVSLIGSAIVFAYSLVVSILAFAVVAGGLMGVFVSTGYGSNVSAGALTHLLQMGAGPVLIMVVLGVILVFAGAVLTTAMQLVSLNAVGQWFCRFDVNRWGLSADELPNDVPRRGSTWVGAVPVQPHEAGPQETDSQKTSPQQGTAGEPAADGRNSDVPVPGAGESAADTASDGAKGPQQASGPDENPLAGLTPQNDDAVGSPQVEAREASAEHDAKPAAGVDRVDGAIPLGPVSSGADIAEQGPTENPADDSTAK